MADDAIDAVDRWIDLPLVGLLSINDHTPGQRQFLDPEKLRHYHTSKFGMTNDAVRGVQRPRDRSCTTGTPPAIAARSWRAPRPARCRSPATTTPRASMCRRRCENGMTIAEFPTTREAAQASREAGLAVLVGAPNLVLGGSHSGNIAAIDLLRDGQADILSSDYVPASLMESVFKLPRRRGRHLAARRRCALASLNPARAVGLGDRGEIAAATPRRPRAGARIRGRARGARGVARGRARRLT